MATSVEQFMTVASQLINEAAAYAAAPPNEETSANIRQIRTMTAALMAALDQVRTPMIPPSTVPPMPTGAAASHSRR